MAAEALFRISPFRFAESARLIIHLHRRSRLLRACACGMIAATALRQQRCQEPAKSNNQAAIRARRDKGDRFP
jgi:hypothetical protein